MQKSRLEFDKRNRARRETPFTHPFGIDFLCEQDICEVCQSGTSAVKPEVTSRLAEYCLITVMDLFMTDTTGVDRWRIGVRWVKDHRLVGWINFAMWWHTSKHCTAMLHTCTRTRRHCGTSPMHHLKALTHRHTGGTRMWARHTPNYCTTGHTDCYCSRHHRHWTTWKIDV